MKLLNLRLVGLRLSSPLMLYIASHAASGAEESHADVERNIVWSRGSSKVTIELGSDQLQCQEEIEGRILAWPPSEIGVSIVPTGYLREFPLVEEKGDNQRDAFEKGCPNVRVINSDGIDGEAHAFLEKKGRRALDLSKQAPSGEADSFYYYQFKLAGKPGNFKLLIANRTAYKYQLSTKLFLGSLRALGAGTLEGSELVDLEVIVPLGSTIVVSPRSAPSRRDFTHFHALVDASKGVDLELNSASSSGNAGQLLK